MAVAHNTVVNLAQKFSKFFDHWSPKVVAELNDYQIELVKFQGDFVWHDHPNSVSELTAPNDIWI